MSNVLAIDIGGTHFRLGVFEAEGRRLKLSEGATLRSGGRQWMLEQIAVRCRDWLSDSKLAVKACGISFGGPVDFEHQRVTSIHSPGWKNFALGDWAHDTLRLPCRLDNDANAGALGEYYFGAGRGTRSIVYITLSTGIGGGMIWDGKIFRGKDSLAGEIGHIPVSDAGVPCSCGSKGCLETFCSGVAIAQRARDWGQRRPERVARMVELSGGAVEDITAEAVLLAADEGDPAAVHIVREVARWLARGLLTVVRVVNPDKIILGGGVAQAGSVLLGPVYGYLEEFSSPTIRCSTQIVVAELETYSPLRGAAAMAINLIEQAPPCTS